MFNYQLLVLGEYYEKPTRCPIDVLNRISGFHQYCLDAPRRLCYVSGNLCTLLGAGEPVLLSAKTDGYLLFLHPEDREEYERLFLELSQKTQTKTLQYRLVCRDGRILHVIDTVTSYVLDGRRKADSILTDITGQQERTQQETGRYLRALSGKMDRYTKDPALYKTEVFLRFLMGFFGHRK